MAPRAWQASMSVGIETFDHEHRQILAMLNLLQDAIDLDDARTARLLLDALVGRLAEHFLSEEAYLRGSPGLDEHIRHHDEARAAIADLNRQFHAGGLTATALVARLQDFFVDVLIPEDQRCIGGMEPLGRQEKGAD